MVGIALSSITRQPQTDFSTRWLAWHTHEASRNGIAARPLLELSWNSAPSWLALCAFPPAITSLTSTMATKLQESDARDGLIFSLNAAIDALGLAKEISMPAKAIFGSVSALLTMIRVCSLFFCDDGALTHIYSGFHGQRSGLHQSWVALRRDL